MVRDVFPFLKLLEVYLCGFLTPAESGLVTVAKTTLDLIHTVLVEEVHN